MFKTSVVYESNYNATEDIVVNQGGTSSGKTYSILQVLFTKAIEAPNLVITVVGQDIPNMRGGVIRDAESIVRDSPDLQSYITTFNKSSLTYQFFNGSIMEFKSYETSQDAKSGKRDYLFVNEANGIPFQVWDELNTRTKIQSFIDYNPNAEFWVHNDVIPLTDKLTGKPVTKLIISDYRHNPFCPEKTIRKIENRMDDTEWFDVYGRGKTGRIEGLIFKNWYAVPSISEDAKFLAYWLDFGFTNDPTSFGEMYLHNGEIWANELIYESGLVNVLPKDSKTYVPNINDKLKELGINVNREIIADSAEQKSIAELANCGWNIRGVKKYAGCVKDRIDTLKSYKINVTQRSVNTRRELNSYRWKTKMQKVDQKTSMLLTLNEPVDVDNHSLDGMGYVAQEKLGQNKGSGRYSIM